MKNIILCFLIAFISITISSCSDSNDAPVFVLSNATIAGTYNMSNFNTDEFKKFLKE